MSKYSNYHWCGVPECKNTSIKTPEKLWIKVPIDLIRRKAWFEAAGRNSEHLEKNARLYFCEDHFDLENDMENFVKFKLMGPTKQIKMKLHCVPSKFMRKHKSASNESFAEAKRPRMSSCPQDFIQYHQDHVEEDINQASSRIKDSQSALDGPSMANKCDKAVQVIQLQGHKATQVVLGKKNKAIQVCRTAKYRSKNVQAGGQNKDDKTLPMKFLVSIATSPLKPSMKNDALPSMSELTASHKLCFVEENCDSDASCAPSLVGSTIDHNYSPPVISLSITSSDASLQEECKKLAKINLQSTLSKINNNPKLYIGLPKNLYFLIDLIIKHTKCSEQNILLCLMKIKLNRTFGQLADDFDLSVAQASNIFFNNLPSILNVLSPFIQQFSIESIKKNLPIAFRHKYNQVTCIIDCLEIEIQKPTKAIHQALSWSEYKKTNTIKYLISCTPDGLVNYVSNGYAGRISDVNLVEHSKFLEYLHPGSCILADRGFKHLEFYLQQKGFVLLRPPSVFAGQKHSKTEIKQTKQIASLRIHIERVIRRVREFSMLKMHAVINSNLIGMLDACVTTACALINLQDALIK